MVLAGALRRQAGTREVVCRNCRRRGRAISLDCQLYKDVGSKEGTGEADIDAVTLAAVFHF
jgi:hypothetical protein